MAPESAPAPVTPERATRERPAPGLAYGAGTTRDTDATVRMDAARGRPNGASRGPMTPREPAPVTPPAKTRIGERTSDDGGIPGGRDVAAPVLLGPGRGVQELRGRPCAWHPSCEGRSQLAPDRWAVVMESGTTLARVRVGPFADRAEATSNLRELESRGFKPFIAEESGDPDEIRRQSRIDLGSRSGHRPSHGGHHRPRGWHGGGGGRGARRARPAHHRDRRPRAAGRSGSVPTPSMPLPSRTPSGAPWTPTAASTSSSMPWAAAPSSPARPPISTS